MLGALGSLAPADSESHAALPPGFEKSAAVSGLSFPVSFDFTPDGAIIIGEYAGGVRIWRDGVLHLAATLEVHPVDESGLNGLAVDPDYAINNHVWVYRTMENNLRQRLSRFTVTDNTLTNEVVFLEFQSFTTVHHGGAIRFDQQKRLYIASGDDDRRSTASQNPFSLHGKVIRINRDGSVPLDNPFYDGVAADPRILASGFRNPFRFSFEPGTDNLFVADVGAGAWEELNLVVPGANYGWAEVEGFTPPGVPGVTYPIFAYEHFGGLGNSIIGGEHAGPGDFAPEYEGDYFYGDEAGQQVRRLVLSPTHEVILDEAFETQALHPVELRFGPDGALYYMAIYDGTLQRIAFVGGANRAPNAVGQAQPASGLAPLNVLLTGVGSNDPDQDPLTYLWDAGQGGGTSTNIDFVHQYPAGVWFADLTVDDGQGGTDTTPPIRVVSGNRAPTASIVSPIDETTFNAGDSFVYGGAGSDPENGTLSCASFSWLLTRHHLGHTHPLLGPLQGICGGNYTIPVTGESSPDIFYEIRLEVQDDGAPLGPAAVLEHASTVQLRPNLSSFTLATTPNPGLTVTLDDALTTAPETVNGVVNFQRKIGVVSPQVAADGHTYQFDSWSDAGAMTHTIATPAAATTYTAHFDCDVIVEVANLQVSPAAGGQLTLTWDPIADPCAVAGPTRYQVFAAATARPASPPGSFPADPAFVLLGTSATTSLTFTPGASTQYYLVVATGTDGAAGPSGHYGN